MVLIVEDGKTVSTILSETLQNRLGVQTMIANTFKECEEIMDKNREKIDVAILDIHLPDALNGEIVDFMLTFNIPSIVMTGRYDDNLKDKIEEKNVIDYIIKDSSASLDQLVNMVKRAINNKKIKALVVDDSKSFRFYVSMLLKKQRLQVLEAENGIEALEIFEKHDDIKVVLTDYIMPKMDGMELTKKLRRLRNKDTLSIIVMSAQDDKKIPSMFLKLGANDFLYKPFSNDEFNTRLNSNLELLELFQETKDMAERDFLTELYNRRYFFEIGKKLFLNAKRKNTKIAIGMLDIDHFKKINDTYGHEVGDIAIKELAKILLKSFRESDIIARFGGEEFIIMLVDANFEAIFDIFERVRSKVARNKIKLSDEMELSYSVSIGVTHILKDTLEEMISDADRMLYEAKNSGRNQVKILKT